MSKSKEEIEEILEYVIKRIGKRIPKKPDVSAYNGMVVCLCISAPAALHPMT